MPKGKMSSGQRYRCRTSPEMGPKGGASDPDFGWFVDNTISVRADGEQKPVLVDRITNANNMEPVDRAPIDPDITVSEFLVAMKSLADTTQTAMAEELGQNISNFSFWFRGLRIPSHKNLAKIQAVFGLTDEEAQTLRSNSVIQQETGQFRDSDESRSEDNHFSTQMMAAFVVRAEQGPPLSDAEAGLIKFIIERGAERPSGSQG